MFERYKDSDAAALSKMSPQQLENAVQSRVKTLSTFEPRIQEEQLTLKTISLPGKSDQKLFVGVYFTDEDIPGESMRLAMLVSTAQPKDIFRDLDAVSATQNSFLSEQSLDTRVPPMFLLQRNLLLEGVEKTVEVRCTLQSK